MSEGEMSGRRGDDADMPVVLHRLTSLERRVDSGFDRIYDRLDDLAFVPTKVYEAEKREADRRISTLERKLEPGGDTANDIVDARRIGLWAVSLIVGGIVLAIIGVIVEAAIR